LIARADAARDANRPDAAAALYLEAFRYGLDRPDLRIQCGNMLKDSGRYADANDQYRHALNKLPSDADLALQMGHLHKLAANLELARESYSRALRLRPDWAEPERELAALDRVMDDLSEPSWCVPELLPRPSQERMHSDIELLRVHQLGRSTNRGTTGAKMLRGIEAVRGYLVTASAVAEVQLLLDSQVICADPPVTFARSGAAAVSFKHVFNLWYDFSAVAPGPHLIELVFTDVRGHVVHRHRETLRVATPLSEAMGDISDAWVPPLSGTEPLTDTINARASVIRPAQRQVLPAHLGNILVQRTDQLGDLVCSVPAIERLRALFPTARLVGLVTPANEALALSLSLFDEVLTVEFAEDPGEGRRILDAQSQARLRQLLAPYAFDLAIDLGEGDDSRPLLLLSGARFLYGFRARQFPWLNAGLDFGAHDPVNHNDIIPPSRKFVLLVEGLAAMMQSEARPRPSADRTGLAELNLASDDRYAVIHTGARLFFSRWPHFDILVRMIMERTDLKVVLLSDDTRLQATDYEGRLQILAGQIPFRRLDALFSHCAAFIGNDSGPKHLAALRGAPVVSVHIPRNNWSEWGPEISGTIITRRVPCAGCGIGPDGEDCGKEFACIRHVAPEEVFAAMVPLLDTRN
jgi:ADP-heptose:LPS heptosyltransferase